MYIFTPSEFEVTTDYFGQKSFILHDRITPFRFQGSRHPYYLFLISHSVPKLMYKALRRASVRFFSSQRVLKSGALLMLATVGSTAKHRSGSGIL